MTIHVGVSTLSVCVVIDFLRFMFSYTWDIKVNTLQIIVPFD